MAENNTTKIEREYVIPLRQKCRVVPRYKKTPKAVKTVKEFLARHMKIEKRDLKKVKLDIHLNEALWHRGIKNPIHKIKVKAVKEGDIVRAYAVDLPTNISFKKARLEKRSETAKAAVEAQRKANQTMMEKAKEAAKGTESVDKEIKEAEKELKVAKEEKAEAEKKAPAKKKATKKKVEATEEKKE